MTERLSAGRTVHFDFEGQPIECADGMTLAAALTAAGEYRVRNSDDGQGRGIFCGMGVCQECRLVVDGQSGVRACMTRATKSMRVERQSAQARVSSAEKPSLADEDLPVEMPELLVIGSGPAGLSAAATAAEQGIDVLLLDERVKAGGQYFKQPYAPDGTAPSLVGDPQIAAGRALIERARRAGVTMRSGVAVWGAFAPREFAVFDGTGSKLYQPGRAIIAAGAYERGLPLPGWTLPGVMTTGAAQTLLRSYSVLPGKRVLVAGNGPLNMQVALELQRAGADLVAVLELAPRPGLSQFPAAVRMALNAPGITRQGWQILKDLRALNVPVIHGHGLVSIGKSDGGLQVLVGKVGDAGIAGDRSFDVDVVCMGYGFQPNNEILRSLGCAHTWDAARGSLVTTRDADCATSVSGIYAIGDCCGLGGAHAAREEGIIAATAVVRSLGGELSPDLVREEQRARRRLRRHRAFQAALWQLFGARQYMAELALPDTEVCRCENVSRAQIEGVLREGNVSLAALKRRTRLGMGPCQGRYCAPVAAAMIAGYNDATPDEFSLFAPRVPFKPVRVTDIVTPSSR
ncbi:MAG: FAD-dependent oxidoreductase [Gammaproteobacteria bacterium]|nr:FAD-dependent oxidoreductase [Gammaproteobacteria bacterium]